MEVDGGLFNYWFYWFLFDFFLFGLDRGMSLFRKDWFLGGYFYNFKYYIFWYI